MANYNVRVTFHELGGKYYVTAEPYPIPKGGRLKKGDTVTWTATDVNGSTMVNLKVGFDVSYDLNNPMVIKRTSPTGPFDNLQENMNVVIGLQSNELLTEEWRYFCLYFRNDQWTPWKPGFVGASEGGVDTHRPPPP